MAESSEDVKVPMDFGIENLQCPVHSNIELLVSNNEIVKANSMILSLNSPVIDHLTTELHQGALESQDFQKKCI